MLKELRLKNFKSFAEEQTIPFAPVTLFVGANGSGKSNALDALRFLKGVGTGLALRDILGGHIVGGQLVFPAIRGGASEIAWNSQAPVMCGVTMEFHPEQSSDVNGNGKDPSEHAPKTRVEHCLVFDHRGTPLVDRETIRLISDSSKQTSLLDANRFGPAGSQVTFGETPSHQPHLFGEAEFLSSLLDVAEYAYDPEPARLLLDYRRELSDIRFFDLRPSDMREYADARQTGLASTGRNLSAVLARICKDKERKQMLLGWIGALCVPEITDIAFVETELGDVIFQLVESNGHRRKVSARSVSDGTLRFLALLAAMFTAPRGSVLVLEEIENGLHPYRVHLLVELFEQFTEFRDIQVIATTHSPQVLLALSDEARHTAILFARNVEYTGTVVRRLGDLPHFDDVAKKAGIDELFATGWLEFAV